VTRVDRELVVPAAEIAPETIEQLRWLETDLFRRLNQRERWRFCASNPELIRLWGRMKDDLARVRALIERQPPEEAADSELRALLEHAPGADEKWSVPAARELSYSITEILPRFGDATYLATLLDDREIADRFKDRFGKDALKASREALRESPPVVTRAREQLIELHRGRARKRRKEHARQALRGQALLWLLVILIPIVVAAAAVVAAASRTGLAWGVTGAVLLGALGSVLSGAYKVPKLLKLRELRSFSAGLFLLPVLGAAAGLVLFLLLRTNVVELPGTKTASTYTYALYGFLAGFSEPFFLRLVGRLAGAEKESA
jgi:hypothetical protein